MASYIPGNPISNLNNLEIVELRVISNLIQAQSGAMLQDELRILRNDQAFELGFVPPTVPGN